MVKPIVLTYDHVKYTLEFNRKAVAKMAREGFSLADMGDKAILMIPQLFAGAFIMHHPYLKREKIEEIYDHTPNRMALIEALAELYAVPLEAMMDEVDAADEGNATWERG